MRRLKENGNKDGDISAGRAQASLELAFGLICLMVLFWGAFNVFLWLNKSMLNRQEDYNATRQQISAGAESKSVDESDTARYPKLDIFKP